MSESSAPILTSNRTILRPFAFDDRNELLQLFQDSDVRRFLLDDSLVTDLWVANETAESTERFSVSGAGLWTVRFSEQGPIIGFVGFREFFEPPQLQLLYGLLPAYWGQGLATEVAAAICDHAFQCLKFQTIRAAIDSPNTASRRVIERLGMQFVNTTQCNQSETEFYELNQDDWKLRSGFAIKST